MRARREDWIQPSHVDLDLDLDLAAAFVCALCRGVFGRGSVYACVCVDWRAMSNDAVQ